MTLTSSYKHILFNIVKLQTPHHLLKFTLNNLYDNTNVILFYHDDYYFAVGPYYFSANSTGVTVHFDDVYPYTNYKQVELLYKDYKRTWLISNYRGNLKPYIDKFTDFFYFIS